MASKEVTKKNEMTVIAAGAVQGRILVIRDLQVMLDRDLAELYGAEPGALTRAVRRNKERFPDDFMFQLSTEEWGNLKRQSGISSSGHGGRRFAPYAFTEQGVAMLSSVLRSKRAIAVSIEIMRTFVEIRRAAANFKEIEKRRAGCSAAQEEGPHRLRGGSARRGIKAPAALSGSVRRSRTSAGTSRSR
jgi:hypothetical protein